MYQQYFGLTQKPFLITPDPAFLYPSASHQQALAHLQYGLEREGGFLLLTGEVGTGKTTLCRLFMDELPSQFRLAYILNAKLDSAAVLANICAELTISVADNRDINSLVAAIYDDLLNNYSANKRCLVVIEEAQNLSADVLETLRLLTNLETNTTKLLHILLVGQPELLDTLAQTGLRQLNQRVVSRCHLQPLNCQELHHYVNHRIRIAGSTRSLFTVGALNGLYRYSGGIPRLVNLLAEHCLLGAYGQSQEQVTKKTVKHGAQELKGSLGLWGKKSSLLVYGVLALLTVTLGIALWFIPPIVKHKALEASPIEPSQLEPSQLEPSHGPTLAEVSGQTSATAFQHLLKLWGIDAQVINQQQLCAAAAAEQLFCENLALQSLNDILAINRPMLLSLHNGSDGLDFYTLKTVEKNSLLLVNSHGERWLSSEQLFARVQGHGRYLWRKPKGFNTPIYTGSSNPPIVTFITNYLSDAGYLTEPLITGGVYSAYLAEKVQQFQEDNGLDNDGIIGQQTLLRMNSSAPKLYKGEG